MTVQDGEVLGYLPLALGCLLASERGACSSCAWPHISRVFLPLCQQWGGEEMLASTWGLLNPSQHFRKLLAALCFQSFHSAREPEDHVSGSAPAWGGWAVDTRRTLSTWGGPGVILCDVTWFQTSVSTHYFWSSPWVGLTSMRQTSTPPYNILGMYVDSDTKSMPAFRHCSLLKLGVRKEEKRTEILQNVSPELCWIYLFIYVRCLLSATLHVLFTVPPNCPVPHKHTPTLVRHRNLTR